MRIRLDFFFHYYIGRKRGTCPVVCFTPGVHFYGWFSCGAVYCAFVGSLMSINGTAHQTCT